MTWPAAHTDPETDLLLERFVPVARGTVWTAWTRPQHLMRWFAPRPARVVECDIDLRPGGVFRTVIRSSEGEERTTLGCYLEVVPLEKLIWTTALGPEFRPKAEGSFLLFTAVISLEARDGGTYHRAVVMHGDHISRNRHEERGFYEGWGTAISQLVESYGWTRENGHSRPAEQ